MYFHSFECALNVKGRYVSRLCEKKGIETRWEHKKEPPVLPTKLEIMLRRFLNPPYTLKKILPQPP